MAAAFWSVAKLDFNRVVQIALATLSLGVAGVIVFLMVQQSRTQHLAIAAGGSSGESCILSAALKTVEERAYPHIQVALTETGGTVENLKMLEDGHAQMATAQADVLAGPKARSVAVLYEDTF